MIEILLEELSHLGISNVVVSENASYKNNGLVFRKVKDCRSAAFFALGLSKMSQTPTVIILNEDYISNTYSGITEAWFQKVPIIVITSNANYDNRLNYLERCTLAQFCISSKDNITDVVSKVTLLTGPSIIRTQDPDIIEPRINYKPLLKSISHYLNKGDFLFYYNGTDSLDSYDFHMTNIEPRNKYCLISKYLGWLIGCAENGILCIPESVLCFDTNIFNNRYIPSKFRLICIEDGSHTFGKIDGWIESNGFIVNTITCESQKLSDSLKIDLSISFINDYPYVYTD